MEKKKNRIEMSFALFKYFFLNLIFSGHGGKVMNITNVTDSANHSLFQHLKDNPPHAPEGSAGNRDKTEIDHQVRRS